MTVRELLTALVVAHETPSANDVGWVSIRNPQWPWRRIVDAAARGEVRVSRVGRTLLMRREELDRWLEEQAISRRSVEPVDLVDPDEANIQKTMEMAGLRRSRRRA